MLELSMETKRDPTRQTKKRWSAETERRPKIQTEKSVNTEKEKSDLSVTEKTGRRDEKAVFRGNLTQSQI